MMIAGALLATAAIMTAVTVNGSLQVLGTLTAAIVDFSGAASTAPMKTGAALPASCSVGQAFFKTDAAAGQNIYLCTAANTWTQVQGSSGAGGGGSFDWIPNSRYINMVADFAGTPYNVTTWTENGFHFTRISGSNAFNNPAPAGDFRDAGLLSFSTTATAANIIRVGSQLMYATSPSVNESLYGRTSYPWDLRVRFRIPPSSTLTNTVFTVCLSNSSASDPPGGGLGVRYVDGTDNNYTFWGTKWSGWGTTVDTGVAADTNWHMLRIRSDGSQAHRILLSLDGGTEVSVCPSGCNITVENDWGVSSPPQLMFFLKTTDAVQKFMHIDYASFWMDRGAER